MALSDKINNKVFYVYKPNNKVNMISNNEIVKKKYVPDAFITKETWGIEETELIAVAKIKVLQPTYIYYEFKYGYKIAQTYEWMYEIIRTYKTK